MNFLAHIIILTCVAPTFQTSITTSTKQGRPSHHNGPPPQAFMNTPQLIRYYNYTVEDHKVITEDGYILTLFRIPPDKANDEDFLEDDPRSRKRRRINNEPVILQHGLLCSSNDWFIIQPEDTLPFLLADEGYDVWLGNCRGNNYSQGHTSESVDSAKYWDFSFHEMGAYDIPAVIKYILNETDKEQLNYIGHSMGTTMFFIAMDQHPELQAKIRRMVALSPAVYLANARTPMAIISLAPSVALTSFMNLMNGGRILNEDVNGWLNANGPLLCSGTIPAAMCDNLFFFITGYDYDSTTHFITAMIAGHTPSEGSGKTLAHYLQWMRTPDFRQYDYGEIMNFKVYGAITPPLYNLTNNLVKTLVMYGNNDWLVVPKDAEHVIQELGNVISMEVKDDKFNHLDFTYAKCAKDLVYDPAIEFLAS